jgi:hypothetical protein
VKGAVQGLWWRQSLCQRGVCAGGCVFNVGYRLLKVWCGKTVLILEHINDVAKAHSGCW